MSRVTLRLALASGIAAALLTLVFSARYGIFRDEMYYWVCARHLAWGYVDHPPLSVFVLRFFGDRLLMMKTPAAMAFGFSVFLVARQAAAMGAGRWGTAITAVSTGLCPLLAAIGGLFSMNVLELAFWASATTITTRLLIDPKPARWLTLGLVIGLGLLNKYSMLMFPAGLIVGLVATPARRQLLTPWPWLAGVVAALIFSPHLFWEFQHHTPSLEFMRRATGLKMASIGPFDFVKEQLLVTNPVIALVWIAGLLGLLFSAHLRPWRTYGIAFLVSAAILMASGKSRASYLGPSYTLLFPAGGAVFEHVIAARMAWARRAILTLIIASGLATLPFALPILPVDRLIAYQHALGLMPRSEEHARLGPLPQFMADRFGWWEMAMAMEAAYLSLPADTQTRTFVFARNYGEAAAIEYFSPRLRGRVLSGHNNYHLWFPGGWDGTAVLVIGDSAADVHKAFADVVEVGRGGDHPLAMPYERNLAIYFARRPTQTLAEIARAIKHFD